MARKILIILGIAAILALTPTLGMAYSFGLSGATVAGQMHSDQGQPNVYFKLKWHDATNLPGTPSFGMAQFDLALLVGPGVLLDVPLASTVGGQTITGNTVNVDYWLEGGHSIHKYPSSSSDLPYGPATGYIELTSVNFAKEAAGNSYDILTLNGMMFGGLYDGWAFTLTASSTNQSPENQFAAKYNGYVGGGSGAVPFKSVTADVATPEPGTMLLLGSSLGLMGFLRRRRKKEQPVA